MTSFMPAPEFPSLDADTIHAIGLGLAKARQTGTIIGLPLDRIQSLEDARAIQVEAFEALGEPCCGLTALSLSPAAGNDPESLVVGLLSKERLCDPAEPFRAPWGLLGLRCALLFTSFTMFPERDSLHRRDWLSTIGRCNFAVELLGRRVPGPQPLDLVTATADFGLHIATFKGSVVVDGFTSSQPVQIRIDGNLVAEFDLARFLDGATNELSRLALALARRDQSVGLGDKISVGPPLPALQVLAGQTISVDFAGLGAIDLRLV